MLSRLRSRIDSALSSPPSPTVVKLSPTPTFTQAKTNTTGIFIPYWGMNEGGSDLSFYDEAIYFGVAATEEGLNKNEDGYHQLPQFTPLAEGKKTYLAIRMIDSDTNFSILKDQEAQQRIIQESITLALSRGFDGIVLNLELSALPFDSLIDQITAFNTQFYEQVKHNNLTYAITAYGDTFFRVRPFDMEKLSQKSDQVMIMAYDFHKAKGNPGPNFPLKGRETYGYDFETMIDNYLEYYSPEDITVIFGFYGYDWLVDEDNISQELADPISLLEARQSLIEDCVYTSCTWQRDNESGEIKAEYVDDSGEKHIVWFEDTESVKRKSAFLQSRGIGSVAHWAYSYF